MDWNYQRCDFPQMSRTGKKHYAIYLASRVFDCEDDARCEITRRDFVGETWAYSEAQAVNNVRFRNGDKHSYYCDDKMESWYEAEVMS